MTAEEFAAWLEAHHLSDQQAARLFGLSRGSVWRYRQPAGRDQRPVHPTVARMCRLIDMAQGFVLPALEQMAREEEKVGVGEK